MNNIKVQVVSACFDDVRLGDSFNGSKGRIRTADPIIMSDVL